MDWLSWALLGAVILHIFEEFVYPGGFVAWYRRYRVDASRITTRFLVIINAADSVLGHCNNWTSRSGRPLLAHHRRPNLLKWMLACLGQFQVSRILSWSGYRGSDLCPFRNLRLQAFSAVRRSFTDDCADRSRYRCFVSLLVCTFS
jgi:hypothetical protein